MGRPLDQDRPDVFLTFNQFVSFISVCFFNIDYEPEDGLAHAETCFIKQT